MTIASADGSSPARATASLMPSGTRRVVDGDDGDAIANVVTNQL
jgi:hypothetical protein